MILLEFTESEVALLRTLLQQYEEIVHGEGDPVLERLFPAAYREDPDAAAEFARYTRSGLADSKTAGAGVIAAALTEGEGLVTLSDEDAARWLPVLTDLRLIIAERLGIERDEDEIPESPLADVYHWLGALQAHLVAALDALA
jgi:hypothetical protein